MSACPQRDNRKSPVPEVSGHLSETVLNTVDPRVARSQEYIDAAFVALLHRRAYPAIRVSDIVRKAGVGRATFYAHYATKHALLASQLQRIVAPLMTATSTGELDCTRLFEHIASAPGIYRGLMSGASAPIVHGLLRDCFAARIAELGSITRMQSVPPALQRRMVASLVLAQVEWWLEDLHAHSPADMQRCLATMLFRRAQAGSFPDAEAAGH